MVTVRGVGVFLSHVTQIYKKSQVFHTARKSPARKKQRSNAYSHLALEHRYDEEDGVISDCWSQPDASKFKVRGRTYLTDGIKINSARSTFQCLAIHLCRVRTKIDHVAERTLFLSLSFESSYHEKHIKKQVRINLPN